jgi:hypothetical protein
MNIYGSIKQLVQAVFKTQSSAPSAPASDELALYVDSGKELNARDSADTRRAILVDITGATDGQIPKYNSSTDTFDMGVDDATGPTLTIQTETAIGSLGVASGLNGGLGHDLVAASFDRTVANTSFYNCEENNVDLVDSSANARTLTKTGTAAQIATSSYDAASNMVDTTGASRFASTDAFFQAGATGFAFGFWGKFQDITASSIICINGDDTSNDRSFKLYTSGSAILFAGGVTAGSYDQTRTLVSFTTESIANNELHWYGFICDPTNGYFYTYIDGTLRSAVSIAGITIRNPTTTRMTFFADKDGASLLDIHIDEIGWLDAVPGADEFLKLASQKKAHTDGSGIFSRAWWGKRTDANGKTEKIDLDPFVTAVDTSNFYFNFGSFGSTEQIEAKVK